MILYAIIVVLLGVLVSAFLLHEEQEKKIVTLDKKYLDKMDEVTNKYFEYDEEIEGLKLQKAILFESEQIQEGKVEELLKYKTRSIYRLKRIKTLEKKLAAATGDKKVLRGRKLTK